MIRLDGALGEGGGQILRSALSLSICTGQPFEIFNVRAKRKKTGLMRQHLTALNAAAEICDAKVEGGQVGSEKIVFTPGKLKSGKFNFSVGTAGSATLVAQTIMLPLMLSGKRSCIVVEGGTHNPFAPTFHYLSEVYVFMLKRFGLSCAVELLDWGFYPAGGGKIKIEIPSAKAPVFQPLSLPEKFVLESSGVLGVVSGIPEAIARDEVEMVSNVFDLNNFQKQVLQVDSEGPGNLLLLKLASMDSVAMFTGFGQQGVSRKKIAGSVCNEAKNFLSSGANLDFYMADQILLPLSLCGGGAFTTNKLDSHVVTNIEVIKKFLPVDVEVKKVRENLYQVAVDLKR